jgi:hypothetical protein
MHLMSDHSGKETDTDHYIVEAEVRDRLAVKK